MDSPVTPKQLSPGGPALRDVALAGPNLLIVEVMADPSAVGDAAGEYIKLYNPGPVDVDLQNYKIFSASGVNVYNPPSLNSVESHTIASSVKIPVGACVVLGNNTASASNGGITTEAYSYGGSITLGNNNTDWVEIKTDGGRLLDSVAYSASTIAGSTRTVGTPAYTAKTGVAQSVIDPSTDHVVMAGADWANATTTYGASTDKGTPNTCGYTYRVGGGGPPPAVLDHIVITGPAAVMVGTAPQYTAQGQDATNNPISPPPAITWSSDKPGILDINPSTGAATPVAVGQATITATSGTVTMSLLVTVAAAAIDRSGQVVISQIYGGGGNNGATIKNDFIELFNRSGSPIDLTGWSVQQTSATAASWSVTTLSGAIQPGAYYLVQEAAGAGGTVDLPTPDATGTIAMGATGGKVLLAQTTTAAADGCPSGTLYVDVVSYSGGNCGKSTGTTANATAALRLNGGCLYTGDPSFDLTIAAPTPRNSSVTRSCVVGPVDHVTVTGTTSILVGGTTQLAASAFDANNNVIVPVTPAWSTSDPGIATVSSTGLVTGAGANSTPATITANLTVNGVTKTGSLDVTVNNPGGINWLDVSYSADSIPPGFQAQMFITARDASGGTVIPATFTVEALDPGIATAINLDSAAIVQGVAAPAVAGTFPRFKITATPTSGTNKTAYVFTTGKSTSIPVEAGVSAGSSIYSKNDELGDPTAASKDNPADFLIKRDQYTISYNQTRGTPNWVAYELDKRQAPGSIDRCNCFTADPQLPADKQIFTSDYTGGGFDRGHMERSADRTAAILDNAATFYLSNVVPQAADLNEGVWAQFEDALGDSAHAGRAVYVIVGPLYTRGKPLTWLNADKHQSKVAIPDSTWKVAVIGPMNGNTPFTLASLQSWSDIAGITLLAVNMPNVSGVRNDPWQKYLTTVHKIEQSTGYDFLSLVPAAFQSAIEADDHAPVARFAMTGTANEGAPLTFDASASTDPDLGRSDMEHTEALTYTWHFSDGTLLSGKTVTKIFADNGGFTASLTVTDAFGFETTTLQTVSVANLPPSATFVTPATWPATEGSSFTLALAGATDPSSIDGATLSFAFDCGAGYGPATSSTTVTCIVQDNGTTNVRAKVIDKDGGFAEYTASFATTNVAPAATLVVPGNLTEGVAFTVSLTNANDPSPVDARQLTYAFDCGKGAFGAASNSASASCRADDNGDLTIRAKVMDKDGGAGEYGTTVHVANTPPSAVFIAPGSVNEGSAFMLRVSNVTDPSTADTEAGFGFAFDCGTGFGPASSATSISCPTTIYGSRSVGVRVADKDGGSRDYTSIVQILNVAPALGGLRDTTMLQGETYLQAASFVDPGTDPWVVTAIYGDGSAAQTLTLSDRLFTVSHRYDAAGTFSLTTTVGDGRATDAKGATVVVQTPAQGVDNLSNAVDALSGGFGASSLRTVDAQQTSLSDSDVRELQGKLGDTKAQLAKDNLRPATNQLTEFIRDVQKDASNGKVSSTAAAPVVAYAQRVITSINR